MWQVVWATLWAEVAPAPGLQGRAGGQLSLHEGQPAFCPLPPASPGEPSWPHVHLVSLPCSFCTPHVLRAYLPRDTEAWCVWGGGWPRTQEAPRGGLWARPELAATPGGKDIPRLAEKPPLPPPTTTLPYPQLQRRRALGGGRGGGALKPAESAPCHLGLFGGQSGPWHWTRRPPPPPSLPIGWFPPFPSDRPLPSDQSPLRHPPANQFPSLTGQVMGGGGEGRQGFVCHLATLPWPWALSREGLGFPDRDQVSQREKEERKTKKRKKRSDLLQLEPS